MIGYNTALVLIGVALLGAACGVIGCYAVLKRRSLTGDVLAHAALPGLCLAYLIVGAREPQALLIGAFVSGLVGIGVMAALKRWTRLKEDAAMALVLGVFFGLGIVFLSVINSWPGGQKAGLNDFIFGKTAGILMEDVELIFWLCLAVLVVVLAFYKEFKLVCFDAAFAQVQGWPAFAIDLLMQFLLMVAVIVGLPVVGVVMMAALLIIPAAAARFWTDRLSLMLLLAGVFGVLAAPLGAFVSASVERMPAGPTIILAMTAIFLLSLVFGIRRGILVRFRQTGRLRSELEPPPVEW